MKATNACIPCMLQQAYNTTVRCTADPAQQRAILDEVLRRYTGLTLDQSPGEHSQIAHDTARELSGVFDPYLAAKQEANAAAMALYPALRQRLAESADPLRDATLLALAGNIIDLGINQEYDLVQDIVHQIERGFDVHDFEGFRAAAAGATRVLYILDNCGEIVFDRLLIEVLGPERVTAVVKAGPIVNDALMADARQVGLADICQVVDTGSHFFGFPWHRVSEAARAEFGAADLVIAKGHANFETVSELGPEGDQVWYLLKAKCDEVARALQARNGDTILLPHPEVRERAG